MKVRTEHKKVDGSTVVEHLGVDRLIAPGNCLPKLYDGNTQHRIVGTITSVENIDGGKVAYLTEEDEFRSVFDVQEVQMPPMVRKLNVTYTDWTDEFLEYHRVVTIHEGDGDE
ncbi:hypothetical protein [Halomonas sp.]|uniref:hypothetical protein n=1 Tax=Halomonas sp. TaxID=1486246 RepID=UPI0035650ED2